MLGPPTGWGIAGRIRVTRVRSLGGVLLVLAVALVLLPLATASHTPAPSSVTIAGSLQSELGCPGDWQPECAATHLTCAATTSGRDESLPAGSFEYKAALKDSWDENYGRNAQANGANIPLDLASGRASSSTTTTRATGSRTTRARSSPSPREASSPSSAARATGIRAASALAAGSRRQRDLLVRDDGVAAGVVRGDAINRAGTRTTARAGCRTGRTSRSASRSQARR